MAYKKWARMTIIFIAVMLISIMGFTAYIDPYFHYHSPLGGVAYEIDNERYQNDGISRHFEYNAVVTGTSMTENFKASEVNSIFSVKSIKIPFAGATYKEISDALYRAIERNPDIKLVVRGLDYSNLVRDKDSMANFDYPTYLYDDNIFNDVNYLLNKNILIEETSATLIYTWRGNTTTTFDEYMYWGDMYEFGKTAVDEVYSRNERCEADNDLTEAEAQMLKGNIEQNVVLMAKENPDIEFYLFFPPYSIYYYDDLHQNGNLKKHFEAEKLAAEELLQCKNIHLFAFEDDFEMICNLDNYKDIAHYSPDINSKILEWMKMGEHELTKETYMQYCDSVYTYYMNYDYEALFK